LTGLVFEKYVLQYCVELAANDSHKQHSYYNYTGVC